MGSLEAGRVIGEAELPRRALVPILITYSVLQGLDFLFQAAYPPGLSLSVVPPEFAWVHALPKVTLDILGTGVVALAVVGVLYLPRVIQLRLRHRRSRHRRALARQQLVGLPAWLFDPRPSVH